MADDYTYLTPQDTAAVLKQHVDKCANLGLILSRYTPREVIDSDLAKAKGLNKGEWLRGLVSRCDPSHNEQLRDLLDARYERWRTQTKDAAQLYMTLDSRMVVGLGGKGSLETGLTVDHVTGLPIIPGSALKGVTRNYRLLKIAEKRGYRLDPDDPKSMNSKLNELEEELTAKEDHPFTVAFGSQKQAGVFLFYDAVPTGRMEHGLFAADVMTPHFVKYYSSGGGEAPHDRDNPNPVSFVTVESGVEFEFAVGARKGVYLTKEVLAHGKLLLKNALLTLGIGAKTAAGYGAFVES